MTVMLCPSDVVDNYVGYPQREAVFALPQVPVPNLVNVSCPPVPPFASLSDRVGINVTLDYGRDVDDYNVGFLRAGWYIDYTRRYNPSTPGVISHCRKLFQSVVLLPVVFPTNCPLGLDEISKLLLSVRTDPDERVLDVRCLGDFN
jgi:hypothetical protein